MLDLAWTELALIAVVAIVVIGPKDLPDAVRGVAKGIQKLRRMASEFQGHVDEVVREAKLEDVRSQINEIRNFDLKGEIERHVDKDGDIRRTFQDDPIRTAFDDTPKWDGGKEAFGPPAPQPASAGAPAFVPPGETPAPASPAFIPPGATPPPAFVPPAGAATPAPVPTGVETPPTTRI
jgi:sec-independent protein translocase protein TatB